MGPVLALLLGLQPLAARADEPADSRSTALDALPPGKLIRVEFGGEYAEGKLRERTRFGLVLADGGTQTTVEAGAVEGLWVRDRFTDQGGLAGTMVTRWDQVYP